MPRHKAKYNALSISSPDALRQGIPASYYLLNTKSHQALGFKFDTTSRYIRLICIVITSRQFKYCLCTAILFVKVWQVLSIIYFHCYSNRRYSVGKKTLTIIYNYLSMMLGLARLSCSTYIIQINDNVCYVRTEHAKRQ